MYTECYNQNTQSFQKQREFLCTERKTKSKNFPGISVRHTISDHNVINLEINTKHTKPLMYGNKHTSKYFTDYSRNLNRTYNISCNE